MPSEPVQIKRMRNYPPPDRQEMDVENGVETVEDPQEKDMPVPDNASTTDMLKYIMNNMATKRDLSTKIGAVQTKVTHIQREQENQKTMINALTARVKALEKSPNSAAATSSTRTGSPPRALNSTANGKNFVPAHAVVKGFCTWEERYSKGLIYSQVKQYLTTLQEKLEDNLKQKIEWTKSEERHPEHWPTQTRIFLVYKEETTREQIISFVRKL